MKRLYCPICKSFPNKVIEVYNKPVEEIRIWDELTKSYELHETNLDNIEYTTYCPKCNVELEFKEINHE